MKEIATYKSMQQFYAVFLLGTILSVILGFFFIPMFMPSGSWDWISILATYVGLPTLIAGLTYYYGWRYKREVVRYDPPDWDFSPVLLTIEEAKSLPKQYNKENYRLVADSKYWMFFAPVIVLVFISSIPIYSFLQDSGINQYAPILFGISFSLLFVITLYSAFKSTSNTASGDFTLPLIREAIKLASVQESIEGVSQIRIVLDKATIDDLSVYQEPRVLLRIRGIEKDAYVESWSEDLGAITRVLCRIYESEPHAQVVWWWVSTDRNYRKYVHPDEVGYYVKSPLASKNSRLGVKDIRLVTETAIALIVQEYIKTRVGPESLKEILVRLNAKAI